MRRSLALISLFVLFAAGMYAQDSIYVVPLPKDTKVKYDVDIEFGKAGISGICIMKTDSTGSKGTVVNEFGIKLMDFTVSSDRSKVELVDVSDFIDKWYIRKVITSDLGILFSSTKDMEGKEQEHRSLSVDTDGTIVLKNTRYNITYNFKINDQKDEVAE